MDDDLELPQPEMTPALAETARRRADLHQTLVALEKASSRPAVGREADWSKAVIRGLEDLANAIREHVEGAERPGGLYEEITARAPRLAAKVDGLRREHPEMAEITRTLLARFETTPIGESWPLADARDELQRLLGRMVRHRQLGADLVWEAYNLDIGGVE